MNGSSWKWGFAVFMLAVVSFSVLGFVKYRVEQKISAFNKQFLDRELEFNKIPPDGGGEYLRYLSSEESETNKVQTMMQVALSILVTLASLFIILAARFGPKDKHWAYATVGTILGFWLHGGLK
jgi:hypothetical protein